MLEAATLHWLEIVGEAASRLSEDLRAAHPEVPWRAIIDFRNLLAHGYDRVLPVRRARAASRARPAQVGGKPDGRVWKCTLCYDRTKDGLEPACAKACPTDSIQFGPLDELRERADRRLEKLQAEGWNGAQLYGHDESDGVGGFGAFFLLLDKPEVYGLPPDPVVTTRHLKDIWGATLVAAGALAAGVAASLIGARA